MTIAAYKCIEIINIYKNIRANLCEITRGLPTNHLRFALYFLDIKLKKKKLTVNPNKSQAINFLLPSKSMIQLAKKQTIMLVP